MFSSRLFQAFYHTFQRLNHPAPLKFSKKLRKAVATGLALYSSSIVFCNTEKFTDFPACEASEIAEGTMKKVQIGENENNFILISKVNGSFYATGGKCSHYGAPLNMGYLDGYNVICPFHAAAFDVRNGEIVQAPGLSSIPTYSAYINNGKVVVRIPESKINAVSNPVVSSRMAKRDLNNNVCFVIIGGGAAGSSAAETLRKEGFTGKVVLLTQENILPYDRVILSKNFATDASKVLLRNQEFFRDYDIEVVLNAEVIKVDTEAKRIKLKDERELGYDKVLIATGSVAKVSQQYKPYLSSENVFTIRSAEDHRRIKEKVSQSQNIVIIGAGFLGLEAAASIKKAWPDKTISILSSDNKSLSRILGSDISSQILATHSINGINFIQDSKILAFNTDQNKVSSLSLSLPSSLAKKPFETKLKTDLILIATGAELKTLFLPSDLLNPDKSVKVNSHLQTVSPDVYAAGDIAQFPSILTESRERIEH